MITIVQETHVECTRILNNMKTLPSGRRKQRHDGVKGERSRGRLRQSTVQLREENKSPLEIRHSSM